VSRLKSEIFVAACLRRATAAGIPAMLRRRGAAEAGAIFVKIDHLDGTASLYAPAPVGDDLPLGLDRQFDTILARVPAFEVEDRMVREIKFDSDLWWIELEDRGDQNFFDEFLSSKI
jgi:hypothetical protein